MMLIFARFICSTDTSNVQNRLAAGLAPRRGRFSLGRQYNDLWRTHLPGAICHAVDSPPATGTLDDDMEENSPDLLIRQIPVVEHRSAKRKGNAADITLIEFKERRLVDPLHIEDLGRRIMDVVNAAATPRLIISFARVDYLSSTALNILIQVENAVNRKGGDLRLCSLAPDLQKVFTIMKLTKVMKICNSTDEAIKSLQN
jgi:anti-anti-sigma factor